MLAPLKEMPSSNNPKHLSGKTLFITGASRGIGRSIALRAAKDGANVAIIAKTVEAHPKLPGTIYSVAEEVRLAGGRALPIQCDIRNDSEIEAAIQKTIDEFGGIDIVVNNASAISLTNISDTSMKRYDLMQDVNVRGAFAVTRAALPYLKKASQAHVLVLSPPISFHPEWFASHTAYTMSKFGMSMATMGLAEELRPFGIAVNSLWPRTCISTSALQAFAVSELHRRSRTTEIMADSAYAIFCQNPKEFTGIFAMDEAIMSAQGIKDLKKYSCDPKVPFTELAVDLFVENDKEYIVPKMTKVLHDNHKSKL